MLDVIALREILQSRGIKREDAEAIAIAIDAKSHDIDLNHLVTQNYMKNKLEALEYRLIYKLGAITFALLCGFTAFTGWLIMYVGR